MSDARAQDGATAGTETSPATKKPAVKARAVRLRRLAMRALTGFFAVPLVVVAVFAALAVFSILADQQLIPLGGIRKGLDQVIGNQAAAPTLQAIAAGVITIASITFSVLLLAVQQTASNLSPVVFDQFIRRKGNQFLLGYFVGLSLYSYVVMAAVQQKNPPIVGAFLATVLTVIALALLLVLIYSTVDQMRPSNVLREIHKRTLAARKYEAELIRRTHRSERSTSRVLATYTADTNGYITEISLPSLARSLARIPNAEVRLHVTLGDYVAYGDVIATVRDDDEEHARSLENTVRAAVVIASERNLQRDATTGIDELGNIAWSSASSAKHNPEVARQALNELRDLAARWMLDPPRNDRNAQGADEHGHDDDDALPIVYPDNDLDRIFQTLFSLLVSAQESRQHMTAARVLDAYAALLPHAPEAERDRIARDLSAADPVLHRVPATPMLDRARSALDRVRKNL